jgi:hypothetical protein
MTEEFPLKLSELLPALEVLAIKDKYVKKLADILSQVRTYAPTISIYSYLYSYLYIAHSPTMLTQEKLVNSGLFPVKVTIPLLLSINAVVTFQKFSRDAAPAALFDVPSEYRRVSLKPPKEKASVKKGKGKK